MFDKHLRCLMRLQFGGAPSVALGRGEAALALTVLDPPVLTET